MHPYITESHYVKYAGLITSAYAMIQYPHVSSFSTVITNHFIGEDFCLEKPLLMAIRQWDLM
jgi:hypothetical protein